MNFLGAWLRGSASPNVGEALGSTPSPTHKKKKLQRQIREILELIRTNPQSPLNKGLL